MLANSPKIIEIAVSIIPLTVLFSRIVFIDVTSLTPAAPATSPFFVGASPVRGEIFVAAVDGGCQLALGKRIE